MTALDILFNFEVADLARLLETSKCKRYVIVLNNCGVFYDTTLLKERILQKMSHFYHCRGFLPGGDFRTIRFQVDSENYLFYLKPKTDADTLDQRQGCFSRFRQCFRRS
uniref:STAS domain-containing protein n=1 Tax=Panagrellus redivivus TaxID=6233 RepID=A0A7E4VCC3_PANRE